jgi:putative PIN family toxin of toxin-antitoxin system
MDTNVLIAGLRSSRGASFRLLSLVGTGAFTLCISVPLILEYEEVALRDIGDLRLRPSDIEDILDFICSVSEHREIFYLWRPFLKDPDDDLVLEVAVEARCDFIVTFNLKDFSGIEKFGLRAITPQRFLNRLRSKQ